MAGQELHVSDAPEPACAKPVLQKQLPEPGTDVEPAGHAVHVESPAMEKVPAGQREQLICAPEPVWEKPAMHVQEVEPSMGNEAVDKPAEPRGHRRQGPGPLSDFQN